MSFEFTTKVGKGDDVQSHTGAVNIGDNLSDASSQFGDEIVYGLYRQQAIVRAQAAVRAMLRGGSSPDQVDAFLSEWRPDTKRTPSADPAGAALRNFAKLSPEEQAATLKRLKASMG